MRGVRNQSKILKPSTGAIKESKKLSYKHETLTQLSSEGYNASMCLGDGPKITTVIEIKL